MKSYYLLDADGNKELYRYDGVFYVIAAMNEEDRVIRSLGDYVEDARLFIWSN